MQLTPRHLSVREDFNRVINMTPDEMRAHFATERSDFASLDPRLAAKRNKVSGRTLGKQALSLKEKAEWEEGDYEKAAECTRTIKKFLGRPATMQTEEGTLTRYAVMLRNRGHDPLKVQEATSLSQYGDKITAAFDLWVKAHLVPDREDEEGNWIPRPWLTNQNIYPDTPCIDPVSLAVVAPNKIIFEWLGGYHELGYDYGPSGDVVIAGTGWEVTPTWEPVAILPTDDITGSPTVVTEADGETGPKWIGTMIAAGAAKNKASNGIPRLYTEAALEAGVAAGYFDNVPGYQRTDAEHGAESGWVQVGTWGKAVWDAATKKVRNTFVWLKDKYPSLIHAGVKRAIAEGRTSDVPGFSITGTVTVDPLRPNVITAINEIRSCDPISFPSAGGTVTDISESLKEQTPMKTTVTEALAKMGLTVPTPLRAQYDKIEVAEGAAAEFMVAQLKEKKAKLFEKMPDLETKLSKDEGMLVALFEDFMAGAGVEPVKTEGGEGGEGAGVTEAVKPAPTQTVADGITPALAATLSAQAVEGVLAQSGLDEVQKTRIRKQFAGRAFDPVAIQEAVQEGKDMQEAYKPDPSRPQIVRTQESKLEQAVNDFFFQDVREHDRRVKVCESMGSGFISRDIAGSNFSLRELFRMLVPGLDPTRSFSGQTNVAEAMDTVLATVLLTNGINARIAFEYKNASVYDGYRDFVDIVNHTDYQTKTAMAYGGFTGFADVAKAQPYQAITESGATAETYAIVKKGGILDIAEEDIRNDNIGHVSSLPRRLSDYARRKKNAFCFGLLTSNPTLASDSTAVFAAGHNNLMYDALAIESLKTAVGMLQGQTHPNSTDKLMSRPAILISSFDPTQQSDAHDLTKNAYGQSNTVANWLQSMNIKVLVNPHTTDTDDWYLLADKNEAPIIELGLLDGREMPEVLSANTAGVGTLFTHDVVQFRVKEAYNGTVVGFKGAVASIVP